ncbi:MAG: glycoside hydrolase family 2 [Alphaproteobacteria bacterium]|nr:glycoside hydrolase family 2 [Alphaproteobacteria bacterium]
MATILAQAPENLRRQPTRDRVSLDGVWDFRLDREEDWRAIQVPGVWQAQFDDLRETQGVTWYRRHFTVPPAFRGRHVVLGFGAVNYLAEVYVNGRLIAQHEGGYLAFEAKLDPELVWEDNLLEVKVTLPSNDRAEFPDHPFQEIPHGKQSWYGPMGGIWQSVWLEARSEAHFRSVRVGSDLATGRVDVDVAVSQPAADLALRLTVIAPDGRAALVVDHAGEGLAEGRVTLAVPDPLPWSPDHPHLYRLGVDLLRGGEVLDTMSLHFGFRTIETRDGRFFLNGQPLYMRCALDQDYYPEGLYTLPNPAYLEDQMRKAKQLGLNTIRCHIKVPDPVYYDICDRLGLLVWTEFPNFERFSEKAAQRARETAEGIIARDGHHPSIIAWTIINEDWGTRLTENPEHRLWLIEQYDWLKAHDPTRLAVDNSACFPNFHVKTDIEDYHYYRGIPDRRREWDELTESFANRTGWTFSPYGDAQKRGDEPLVCSEFGIWGLPNPKDLRRGGTMDPWWFQTGQNWGDGVAYPRGIEQRYRSHFLDRAFGSFDAFIEATQWYQWMGLKYEIEELRKHAAIQGYVITELTDIYWESNGLMDMERNLRAFHEPFAHLNADLVVVPGFERWGYWAGERIAARPRIATGGATLPPGAVLHWTLRPWGLTGEIAVPAAAPSSVVMLDPLDIALPDGGRAEAATLDFTLRDARGHVLARNCEALSVYPPVAPAGDVTAAIWCEDPALAERLEALGFTRTGDFEAADLIVSRIMDTAQVEAVRRGKRALVVYEAGESRWLRADQPTSILPVQYYMHEAFPGLFAQDREHSIHRSDWITAFSWLRRSGLFADIPGGPMFDMSFEKVVPHHVLTGMKPWEFEAHVHAGLVVGWAHKAAALVAERWFGRGKAVLTTFRLTAEPAGSDPVATVLLERLVRQALAN